MTMAIDLHVGRGEHRGPLTVFPICRRGTDGPEVALAEAGDGPGQSGVLIGMGGRPILIELFGTSAMLAAAWPRIIDSAAKEAAGRLNKPTAGWRARQFVAVIDSMQIARYPQATETAITAVNGPYELRGIADGDRLLHASVINREA